MFLFLCFDGYLNKHILGTQNTITDEENNFLRYFLLAQLGTQALRILFDSLVNPMSLENHLKNVKPKLQRCTADQMAILYPGKKNFFVWIYNRVVKCSYEEYVIVQYNRTHFLWACVEHI
jgi:hypothetical protein